VNFHGEKRSNQSHESKTDPDAKLARKSAGKEAKLSYSGNLLVENRNGLIVNAEVFEANGTAERDAALVMLEQIPGTKQLRILNIHLSFLMARGQSKYSSEPSSPTEPRIVFAGKPSDFPERLVIETLGHPPDTE